MRRPAISISLSADSPRAKADLSASTIWAAVRIMAGYLKNDFTRS